MSLLTKITPTNILEEKEKFFADFTYNPQFEYNQPVPHTALTKYGMPSEQLRAEAQEVLDRAFHDTSEQEIEKNEGRLLQQGEVTQKIEAFLEAHKLKERFALSWSASYVSRTTINSTEIKLRLPASYREHDLLGMLYHEIGTHAIRRINYEQQPFYKKKKSYGFKQYLPTEEGLATLHSLLALKNKCAYRPARSYMAASYAHEHTFAETFAYLEPWVDDPEKRWRITLRQKRGVIDTSMPGSFTKDLVYFKGFRQVAEWFPQPLERVNDLYRGKIALEDIDKAVEMNQNFESLLPLFITKDYDMYLERVDQVKKINGLDE